MKNLTLKPFAKNVTKNKLFLGSSIILLLLVLGFCYLGYKNQTMKINDAVDMNTLDISKDMEGKHAYIDITTNPYLFASYETNGHEEAGKLYLVMDKDDYLYIIYMNNKEYTRLNQGLAKQDTMRTLGTLRKIDPGIKEFAISSYNEEIEKEYLTDANFSEYVGIYYLDTISPLNNYFLYYIIAGISFFLFLIFLISYLTNTLKTKKTLKRFSKEELQKIEAEVYALNNNPNEEMKLYLTDNYLIDISSGIIILKYEDIIWAYPYEYFYNGLSVNKNIKICDKDNKKYDICNTKLLKKKQLEVREKVLNILKTKNPKILIGNEKETRRKVKEILKNNKRAKKKFDK